MKQKHDVHARHKDQAVEELQSSSSRSTASTALSHMTVEQPIDPRQIVIITRPSDHELTSEIRDASTVTNFQVFDPYCS